MRGWENSKKENMTAILSNPANLWQRVIDSHQQYSQAFSEFVTNAPDKIDVLRRALRGRDRSLALQVIPSLSMDEKKALLPEWVHLARAAHSPFQFAWNVIESLPREWVLQNLAREVDEILRDEVDTDYWMFLQLYARMDGALARQLAQRASASADPAIRELGEEYLAMGKTTTR